MPGTRVLSLSGGTVSEHSSAEVESLLSRDDALIWVDIPECTDEANTLLTDVLGCHPLAVRDCMQRHRVPRVRIYPHQQLMILHGPERGPSGHVHYLELDQIIGDKYVVTVHDSPGVIKFYRARAETKMTIAAERLAVIAVVTLPITALSSIYGMNIIVNDTTHLPALIVVLSIMAGMSALLLTWAKRRGWR